MNRPQTGTVFAQIATKHKTSRRRPLLAATAIQSGDTARVGNGDQSTTTDPWYLRPGQSQFYPRIGQHGDYRNWQFCDWVYFFGFFWLILIATVALIVASIDYGKNW
jgi:hypothetical protein